MVKLLIIADDFTGALDTGVQFAASGAETRVVTNRDAVFEDVEPGVQVLVLDAETRHLPAREAYDVVFSVTRRACRSKIPYIYKKTDSALRGNVESELKAVLEGTKQPVLHFFPAFPKMNRITRGGVHYIDGVPAEESVFGRDPFEPVRHSAIQDIIKTVPVTVVTELEKWRRMPGIMAYDAATDLELQREGQFLMEKGELSVMAGCAGFAGVLPRLLGLNGKKPSPVLLEKGFFVACGSVNPITRKQLDYAERADFLRIRLSPREKMNEEIYDTDAGRSRLKVWKALSERGPCILDTNDPPGSEETLAYVSERGMTREQMRVRISMTLGRIVKDLVELELTGTLLITGGDCLIGFMKNMGCDIISPICELAPGTVLSEIDTGTRRLRVISKSGGFGTESLLVDLAGKIYGSEKQEELECRKNMC